MIDVEAKSKRRQRNFSMLGVEARKPDELNELIHIIVRKRPTISCNELLAELKRREKAAPIQSIENEEILLFSGKAVPLSGLKDRLSRAKKK